MPRNELSREPRLLSLYNKMSEALAEMVPATFHGALDMALRETLAVIPAGEADRAALLAAMIHEVMFELTLLSGDDMDVQALTDRLLGIVQTGTDAEPVAAVAA